MNAKTTSKIPVRLARLNAILVGGSYSYQNEKELQDQIEARLRKAGVEFKREKQLSKEHGIPDFLVGMPFIVIEVKIKGSRADLLRQIDRYASNDRVGAVLVATTKSSHLDIPSIIQERLVKVAWLSVGAAFGAGERKAEESATPTTGQISRVKEGGWSVTLEPHSMARFKRIFKRVAGRYGTVIVDGRRETCRDLLWFMSRFPLQISEIDLMHITVQAEKYDRQIERVSAIANGEFEAREFEMALPPRDYQAIAAEMALHSGGLLVADDLGLGKTITAITALTDSSTRPAVVVTETHLAQQWEEELAKFAPALRTHIIKKGKPYDVTRPKGARKRNGDQFFIPGGDTDRPFPDVLITTYSKMDGWADTLGMFVRSVIYDEVQALRHGASTLRGKACYHVTEAADRMRMGLSATPIYGLAGEIWAVIEAIAPGRLGTKAEFVTEWCGGNSTQGGGEVADPAALGSWLKQEGLMLRRTRADVGRELPPLSTIPVPVECDLDALDLVKKEVADLARAILGNNLPVLERGRAASEISRKLRQATGIAKAKFVADFVKKLFARGAKNVVLGGWHREVYKIWLEELKEYNPVLYTGSESAAGKRVAKADFVSGKSRILIISLRSGAGLDGLQYTGCTDVVHGEFDWSPAIHKQLTGRVDRDGNPNKTTEWFPYAATGSDPVLIDALGVKSRQAGQLLNPFTANPGEEAVAERNRGKALARYILGRNK